MHTIVMESAAERRRILDEFCANWGYHRKYAIPLLNGPLSCTAVAVTADQVVPPAGCGLFTPLKVTDLRGVQGEGAHVRIPHPSAEIGHDERILLLPAVRSLLCSTLDTSATIEPGFPLNWMRIEP